MKISSLLVFGAFIISVPALIHTSLRDTPSSFQWAAGVKQAEPDESGRLKVADGQDYEKLPLCELPSKLSVSAGGQINHAHAELDLSKYYQELNIQASSQVKAADSYQFVTPKFAASEDLNIRSSQASLGAPALASAPRNPQYPQHGSGQSHAFETASSFDLHLASTSILDSTTNGFDVSLASASASPNAYFVDGVAWNTADSERFYDAGKGYYWQWNGPVDRAEDLFYSTGKNYQFLGELYYRLPKSYQDQQDSFDYKVFNYIKADGETCWYQVSSNILQYWESYYGVFYSSAKQQELGDLLYGYTYDSKYLTDLAGTQSLDIGMLFYDNMKNQAGTIQGIDWYLRGATISALNTDYKPGFFADYFTSGYAYQSYSGFTYNTNYLTSTLANVLGLSKQSDGTYSQTIAGQIAYLGISHISAEGVRSGHALTIYGFELGDDGSIDSLFLTNSDDRYYGLFQVYLAADENGKLFLYTDEARTQRWQYAYIDWYIESVAAVKTPEILQNMYQEYHDSDTPLTWNGQKQYWDGDTKSSLEKLPTASTGWDVYAGTGTVQADYFHSYYEANRKIEFNDHASGSTYGGTVKVSAHISAPEITINSNTLNYNFSSEGVTKTITADSLLKMGNATASFSNINLNINSSSILEGKFSLASGATLSGATATVGLGGTLSFDGGTVNISDRMTVLVGGELEVNATTIVTINTLEMGEGSLMSMTVGTGNLDSGSALFTLNGNILFTDMVELALTGVGLTVDSRYWLMSVTGTYAANWADNFTLTSPGSLQQVNGNLYWVYAESLEKQWTDVSGSATWQNNNGSMWGGQAFNNGDTAIFAGNGNSTVNIVGGVSPQEIRITSGSYTFMGTGSIDGSGALNISNAASLRSTVSLANRRINLADSASFEYAMASGYHAIRELNMASGTTATFSGSAEYSINHSSELNGSIEAKDTTGLRFALSSNVDFGNRLSSAAGTSLTFASNSDHGVTYTLSDDSKLLGSVYVGEEYAMYNSRVKLTGNSSKNYTVNEKGILELAGSSYTGTATGTGLVDISGATSLDVNSIDAGLELLVRGNATIGSASSSTRALTNKMTIQGSLTIYHNNVGGDPYNFITMQYGDITLDGGTLNSVAILFSSYIPDRNMMNDLSQISSLNVSANGGTISTSITGSNWVKNTRLDIQKLSGSGDLRLETNNFASVALFRIGQNEGFTGDIYLAEKSPVYSDPNANTAVIELQGTDLSGSAIKLSTSTHIDLVDYSTALLGISADSKIGGLASDGAKSYLYSGTFKTSETEVSLVNIDKPITDYINAAATHNTLSIDTRGNNYEFKGGVLSQLNLVKQGEGTQKFSGDMASFNGSIAVEGGTLSVSESLNVNDLILTAGTKVILGEGASIKVNGALSSVQAEGAGASVFSASGNTTLIDGNLDLTQADSLSLSMDISLGGNALILSSVNTIEFTNFNLMEGIDLYFMIDVGTLVIDDVSYTTDYRMSASEFFSGDLIGQYTYLLYEAENNRITFHGLIPEPSTVTMSLLALAGLAARRRRKE